MRIVLSFLFYIVASLSVLYAADSQVIRGKITDAVSLLPLEGVTVEVLNFSPRKYVVSDAEGRFRLEEVPIGRYKLLFSKPGYKDISFGIEVTAARESMLNLKMEELPKEETPDNPNPNIDKPTKEQVKPVESVKDRPNSQTALGSVRVFSLEEVNRFAGDRFDASRLVSNYAGVNVLDDYNNHLMIRGNSPYLMEWRLEGMPIANPSHLGTFGSTGGRANILNPNIMDNSDLLIGAFAAEYGNAISGVFDTKLRDGDEERFHVGVQYSSAAGVQALLEGPLSKNRKASFIIGYRYGLFNYLGYGLDLLLNKIDKAILPGFTIPETAPVFQDINLKITVSAGKAGTFTLFGIGGLSRHTLDGFNQGYAERDPFVQLGIRDKYRSQSASAGLKHEVQLGKNRLVYWRNIIGGTYSSVQDDHDIRIVGGDPETTRFLRARREELSYTTHIQRRFSPQFTLGGGAMAQVFYVNLFNRTLEPVGGDDIDSLAQFGNLFRGYAQAVYTPLNNLKIYGGVYGQFFQLNNSYSVEPRLSIRWFFLPRHSIYAAGGMYSQILPFEIYAHKDDSDEGEDEEELNLDMMRSVQATLGYQYLITDSWRLRLDAYYQHLYSIPTSADPDHEEFSLLQYGGILPIEHLDSFVQNGLGRNIGVELSVEKLFDKGFYGFFNATYTHARITGFDGVWRISPFAPRYLLRLVAGKEFKIGKRRQNSISLDLKATHYNFRYTLSVDEANSALAQQTVYDSHNGYTQKLPAYFRLDFKISFNFNSEKAKINHRLAFDFLNVTNYKNVMGYSYSALEQKVVELRQLPVYLDILYQLRF